MAQITALVEWFKNNSAQIAVYASAIIGIASIIVKLTPTQKDDTILAKIVAFMSKYIALNTDKHV